MRRSLNAPELCQPFFINRLGFGMLRPLNAPEAREPRTGRQPTTTEADVRPTADHYRGRRSAAARGFFYFTAVFLFG